MSAPGTALDRVVTVPNVISLIRIALIPVFVWLLFGKDDRAAAAYLLAVLGITDWIDGYIARRYDQVSTVGKILDPTADRLVFLVGVLAIALDGSVPIWIAALTLVREAVVALVALLLASLGARRIDVTFIGKTATALLLIAYPGFLMSHADVGWAPIAGVVAWVTVIPGLVCSYISAAGYVPVAREAVRAGRDRRGRRPEVIQ